MNKSMLLAGISSALAISTATAGDFPAMDVMGPYDTPATASARIEVPQPVADFGLGHSDTSIENASAVAPELPVLGDLPGLPDLPDLPDLPGPDLPGTGDDGDDDDDGGGDGIDLGDILDPKPEKPEKPEPDDDRDGDG